MKETSKKVLKAAAIASLLTGSVIASTGSIFADKANAVTPITASSTTGFTGTIDPSCAVATGFASSTSNAYAKTTYSSSGAGGVLRLETSDTAQFNCNSDTVNVSAAVTATPPTAPVNATSLAGVHTTTLSSDTANANATGTGSTTVAPTNWKTNLQGNIGITVRSTWNPTVDGQELLDGTYTAVAIVTVTPN
ncbi:MULTISPECIES: hypothetical protein [Nostocales]|jgi:hypothetical protein|uniref:Uncharacterized protein n=1 Tax=Dolichospermum flos-aquae UHCC 0037 TaxID=2590026 RepID=A0ACC7S466_DOLFA|nr:MULTISPECIES: hypothetical protein [Nostocales]MBO1064463.1 hypothetical protein [Anabaena sp. 54]MTJ43313.1 hypothetical protein [Dolichospermum flos-aquae UHCC 0037]